MTPKRGHFLHPFYAPVTLRLILFLIAGFGGGDSGAPAPKFSLPLPKGLLAPAPGSGLDMTTNLTVS